MTFKGLVIQSILWPLLIPHCNKISIYDCKTFVDYVPGRHLVVLNLEDIPAPAS